MLDGFRRELRRILQLVVPTDELLGLADQLVGFLAGEVFGEFGLSGQVRCQAGSISERAVTAVRFLCGKAVEGFQGCVHDCAAHCDGRGTSGMRSIARSR